MGTSTPVQVDVRIVAATHRDLAADVTSGRFRADLLHRLRVFTIRVPALSERLDDIPALVTWFLAGSPGCGPVQSASAEFLDALRSRSWPGNVRELKAAVNVAAVLARGGTLRPEHLPAPLGSDEKATHGAMEGTDPDARLHRAVRDWVTARLDGTPSPEGWLHEAFLRTAEAALIGEVLARTDGNRTAAAKVLGLDRSTLRGKLPRG